MSEWKKPEFVEIRMDAEINCYSSALADDPRRILKQPSDSRRRLGKQPGILRPAFSAGPYPWFRCRRRVPAVELQLRQLCWPGSRDDSCETTDAMLGRRLAPTARDGRC